MNRQVAVFEKLLRDSGYFVTKPRLKLFATLQKHNTLSVSELINHLHLQDQATIYRNIKLYEKLGIIKRLHLGSASKIELGDTFEQHHHHFSCISCGTVAVLPDMPVIEKTIAQMSRRLSFRLTDHQLEIRGICNNCIK